jgi:AcrR family transcriptional regulator
VADVARIVKGVKKAAARAGKDDGRSTRWSAHREARRAELVLAAVAAIDAHGPDAGIEEIAAHAGVSKPVLYRYFTDKADLHAAVGAWGGATALERILPALLSDAPVQERVRQGCADYLAAIEEHPNVFLLLVAHRAGPDAGPDDPIADGKAEVAAAMARVMGDTLRDLGVDAAGAEPWAHGLVGLGLATGEWWLSRRTMSRAAVTEYLSAFVWSALEGIAHSYGVAFDTDGRLHLVEPGPRPVGRDETRPTRGRSGA